MKITPEKINAWRIIPRLMVLGFAYVVWDVGNWFMALEDPTNSQAGFSATVYGAIPFVINFYCNTGGASNRE